MPGIDVISGGRSNRAGQQEVFQETVKFSILGIDFPHLVEVC